MLEERKSVAYMTPPAADALLSIAKASAEASRLLGLDIVGTPLMPEGIARVVHADGRVQIIKIDPSEFYAGGEAVT